METEEKAGRMAAYAMYRAFDLALFQLENMCAHFLAKYWNVSVGNKVKFYGIPFFKCLPGGRITIGDNSIVRSSFRSNTAGLNRRSLFSAARGARIILGDSCGVSGTVLAAQKGITIGNRVLCGANCTIIDSDRHPLNPNDRQFNTEAVSKEITIEDDVWLGMNVLVLKGVTIGRGTVVAANSVVTRTLPSNVLAAGSPARVIREH